ncbi:MAG TPA: helix-turn-helix transcriptional regulator [Burkholderiaceae bacterium]|nr:helix-turn-helix transcriptional regulator [Burkholderiaceae bacterium]
MVNILTQRELLCLRWAAAGKTSLETGLILKISSRTVDFHIQNACCKLGAGNRQLAITIAISLDMLPGLPDLLPPLDHLIDRAAARKNTRRMSAPRRSHRQDSGRCAVKAADPGPAHEKTPLPDQAGFFPALPK